MVAQMALERCLSCPEATMIEEEVPQVDDKDKKEKGAERGAEPIAPPRQLDPSSAKPLTPAPVPPTVPMSSGGPTFGTSKKGSGKPSRELILHAKQTLAMAQARQARNPLAMKDEPLPAGQRSLAGLANYMVHGNTSKPAPVQTVTPPVAPPVAAQVAAPKTAP